MERVDNDRERTVEQRCTAPAQIAPSVAVLAALAVLAEVKCQKAKRRRMMSDDNGWGRTLERVDNDRKRTVEQRCTAPAQIAPSVAVPAALAGQRL